MMLCIATALLSVIDTISTLHARTCNPSANGEVTNAERESIYPQCTGQKHQQAQHHALK